MDINELTRQAMQFKLSKKQCANVIQSIADNTVDEDLLESLAMLYSYFIPKATTAKRLKLAKTDPIGWAAMVVAKDHKIEAINFAYAQANVYAESPGDTAYVATDGKRLHIVHNTNMPQGYYDSRAPKTVLDKPELEYPNWQELRRPYIDDCPLSQIKVDPVMVNGDNERIIKLTDPTNVTIGVKEKYWLEAISVMSDRASVELPENNSPPIMIRDFGAEHSPEALVMPYRLQD